MEWSRGLALSIERNAYFIPVPTLLAGPPAPFFIGLGRDTLGRAAFNAIVAKAIVQRYCYVRPVGISRKRSLGTQRRKIIRLGACFPLSRRLP